MMHGQKNIKLGNILICILLE